MYCDLTNVRCIRKTALLSTRNLPTLIRSELPRVSKKTCTELQNTFLDKVKVYFPRRVSKSTLRPIGKYLCSDYSTFARGLDCQFVSVSTLPRLIKLQSEGMLGSASHVVHFRAC